MMCNGYNNYISYQIYIQYFDVFISLYLHILASFFLIILLQAFGVVFGIAMAIFTIVAKEEDSNFVMKGICLTASLVVALFPFVLTQDDA